MLLLADVLDFPGRLLRLFSPPCRRVVPQARCFPDWSETWASWVGPHFVAGLPERCSWPSDLFPRRACHRFFRLLLSFRIPVSRKHGRPAIRSGARALQLRSRHRCVVWPLCILPASLACQGRREAFGIGSLPVGHAVLVSWNFGSRIGCACNRLSLGAAITGNRRRSRPELRVVTSPSSIARSLCHGHVKATRCTSETSLFRPAYCQTVVFCDHHGPESGVLSAATAITESEAVQGHGQRLPTW